MFTSVLNREDLFGPIKACLVNIGDHHESGMTRSVQGVVNGAQAHGAGACEHGSGTACNNPLFVHVCALREMIRGVVATDHAGNRFGE